MTKLIGKYVSELDYIETHIKDLDQQRVWALLLNRDRLADALEVAGNDHSLAERTKLSELDKRLRNLGTALVKRVGSKTLADWRLSLKPDKPTWWWSLDEDVSTREDKRNTVWVLATAFMLALSTAYTVDIATRFLSGGADTTGYLYTAVQVFLTFIAGSAFTDAGRQWVKGLASFGAQELSQQRTSVAIDDLKRARALDPDNTAAHYNLAVSYESILDYDKAIGEYQRTIELDNTYAIAYNNMARLFILKNGDYDRTLEALSKIIDLDGTVHGNSPDPKFLQYTALKNRGWAVTSNSVRR